MHGETSTYRFNFTDYEKFCDLIAEKFNYDISVYTFTIFKRRIEHFFSQFSMKKYSEISSLVKSRKFWVTFSQVFQVPTTEMFRDPEMWENLKNTYLPKLYSNATDKLRIFVPDVTTDEELLSLLILLNEMKISPNTAVVASSPFENIEKQIKKYQIQQKSYEVSQRNYLKCFDKDDFSGYFKENLNSFHFNEDLLENVEFKQINLCEDPEIPEEFDLILFRNRMLYYKPAFQYRILDQLYKKLKTKGYLIIGSMEQFSNWELQNKFNKVEKNCNIFIKKR